MPSAGSLRQRIAVSAIGYAQDAMGAVIETPAPPTMLWADVRPVGANERFAEGALTVRPELRILIRYRDDVRHRDRITWRDRDYEIVAAPRDPDGKRTMLELYCAAREAGQ